MRIGIDARLYNKTGVGRYIRNIIFELSLIDTHNDYIVYLNREDYTNFDPPGKNWTKKLLNIPWHTIKEQIILPSILTKDNLDVVHFPYFNVPIFYPKKYLLTIHDLIVDHFDTGRASTLPSIIYKIKRLGYKTAMKRGILRADVITAISETTKKEIIDHYRVNPEKIIITYDALDNNFKMKLKNQKKEKYYSFPYLLYVGNAYPHKNLEKLIEAFKLLTKKYKSLHLVLAGDDNFFYPRLKKIAKSNNILEKVIFFGEANDKQLINLYSYAKCLVFPSLMEGFGLPNLESIACGTLPAISSIPVFREIWGDEVAMFDPGNFQDIADKISLNINLTNEKYTSKIKKLQTMVQRFSWRATAISTLNLYETIHKSKEI